MLPEGWRETTVGKCLSIMSGYAFKSDDFCDHGVPVIRISNITDMFDIDLSNCVYHNDMGKDFSYIAKMYDVLIAMSGATTGKIGIYKNSEIAYINQRVGKICINDSIANLKYFFYVLNQNYIQKYILKEAIGGAQPNISNRQISIIKINIPPLPEQEKIAAILSTWDKAISTTDALLATSRQQKKALMQQLLTGKRRLPGFTGEWISRHLSEIGTIYTGITGKSKEDFGRGKFFIPYTNIFNNASVDINYLEKVEILDGECQNVVQYGDILFTTSSETPDEVGMSSVVLDEIENIYLNSFCFGFRLHNFCELSPLYAKFLFRGEVFRKNVIVLAQGATRYNLPKKQFLNINISFPPLDEQRAIAAVLDVADREIVLLEQKAARLREEKKALMQQLLTGKRRVRL